MSTRRNRAYIRTNLTCNFYVVIFEFLLCIAFVYLELFNRFRIEDALRPIYTTRLVVYDSCPGHREEMYREETRGKLCHADIFSLLTIENYINSLFY